MGEHNAAEIRGLVERYLAPHQPRDYQLRVLPEGIRQEDDWWYVIVQPSRNDVRSYDYAARLTEAEQDLQDQEHLNVLLVPAMPD